MQRQVQRCQQAKRLGACALCKWQVQVSRQAEQLDKCGLTPAPRSSTLLLVMEISLRRTNRPAGLWEAGDQFDEESELIEVESTSAVWCRVPASSQPCRRAGRAMQVIWCSTCVGLPSGMTTATPWVACAEAASMAFWKATEQSA